MTGNKNFFLGLIIWVFCVFSIAGLINYSFVTHHENAHKQNCLYNGISGSNATVTIKYFGMGGGETNCTGATPQSLIIDAEIENVGYHTESLIFCLFVFWSVWLLIKFL